MIRQHRNFWYASYHRVASLCLLAGVEHRVLTCNPRSGAAIARSSNEPGTLDLDTKV